MDYKKSHQHTGKSLHRSCPVVRILKSAECHFLLWIFPIDFYRKVKIFDKSTMRVLSHKICNKFAAKSMPKVRILLRKYRRFYTAGNQWQNAHFCHGFQVWTTPEILLLWIFCISAAESATTVDYEYTELSLHYYNPHQNLQQQICTIWCSFVTADFLVKMVQIFHCGRSAATPFHLQGPLGYVHTAGIWSENFQSLLAEEPRYSVQWCYKWLNFLP